MKRLMIICLFLASCGNPHPTTVTPDCVPMYTPEQIVRAYDACVSSTNGDAHDLRACESNRKSMEARCSRDYD